MMIKIDAIVREEKFEDVKAALNAIGVNGITVSQVMGCAVQRGSVWLRLFYLREQRAKVRACARPWRLSR